MVEINAEIESERQRERTQSIVCINKHISYMHINIHIHTVVFILVEVMSRYMLIHTVIYFIRLEVE